MKMKPDNEKQAIEEMAALMDGACDVMPLGECYTVDCNKCKAALLYNAGYRKQSAGKWIWINQATGYLEPPYGDTCKCSLCEFVIDISESNYNFCPNCGARMKGGE